MYKTLDDVPKALREEILENNGKLDAGSSLYWGSTVWNRALDLIRGFPDEWPVGANIAVQNDTGSFAFSKADSAAPSAFGGWDIIGENRRGWFGHTEGKIIGDWRTTLRKRPEVSGNSGELEVDDKQPNKYSRKIKGVWIDIYDVLEAYDPDNRNAADDHAIKKMLIAGKRGYKDGIQDRKEAIASLQRSIELLGVKA